MSWIDDIVSFGSNAAKMVASSNIGSSLAKTAVLGLLLNQMNKSVNKQPSLPDTANSTQPDRFVREQMSPNTNHSIPVLYGSAFIKGIITDAFMAVDNQTMWYCITICEKTGTLLSTGQSSVISFNEIWWDNQKLTFNADGITVASAVDGNGNVDTGVAGLIEVYCFNNGSNSPVSPTGYNNVNLFFANSVMPNWSPNHLMSGLVFCIVKITYNKERNVTKLGEFEFKLSNTMTLPGDVIQDYMTNTRYGASIPLAEIYSQ
jgi:hypothetical protein